MYHSHTNRLPWNNASFTNRVDLNLARRQGLINIRNDVIYMFNTH